MSKLSFNLMQFTVHGLNKPGFEVEINIKILRSPQQRYVVYSFNTIVLEAVVIFHLL